MDLLIIHQRGMLTKSGPSFFNHMIMTNAQFYYWKRFMRWEAPSYIYFSFWTRWTYFPLEK